jgi:hypothetical protein
MVFRSVEPDFTKLARRAWRRGRLIVCAFGSLATLEACVNLSPPWEGANQDTALPTGAGGGIVLVDSSAIGGNSGSVSPIEGWAATDAAASVPEDGAGLGGTGGTAAPIDARLPEVRLDGADAAMAWDADNSPDLPLAGVDSEGRDVEKDVSVAGSGGMGGTRLDAATSGSPGSGGAGGSLATDSATDVAALDAGWDSGAGGLGTGGSGTGGNGTGGGGGSVCAGYQSRDAGSGIGEGQIAYYRCESGAGASGTALEDTAGQSHDGTLHSGGTGTAGYSFIAGKVHNALHLSAAQQGYVTLPAGLLANACEATIATWVWLDSSQNWQRIFDFGRDTSAYMFLTPKNNANGKVRFTISLGGNAGEEYVDGAAELPTGAWYHVAVVLSPAGASLYINASKVGSNPGLMLRPADLGDVPNLYIGRSQVAKDPYLDGSIDSFRIYDRALTDAEIAAAYQYDGT